jgi:hypothetical protein
MFTTHPGLIALSATMAMFIPAAGAQAAISQAQHQASRFQSNTQARHMTTRRARQSTKSLLRFGHNNW